MEILVYGAGAVGGYLGARLALAGHDVTLLVRPHVAAPLAAAGLLVTEAGQTQRARVGVATSLAEAFARPTPYALIITGMKAYDLAAAADDLAAVCPDPAQLLCIQNGIGVEDLLVARFGAERVLSASVTVPISRAAANHVEVERAGRGLGLAPVLPGRPIDDWLALFTATGITTVYRPDYRAMKWSKALLNSIANATVAILNRPPAEVYRLPGMFDLEMRMLRETLAVMDRLGLAVVNLPGASARPLARSLSLTPAFVRRPVLTRIVGRGRGDKMPSFYMDLAAGRRQSEVVFHNGAVAAAGRAAGVPAPVNATLNDVLVSLARGDVARSEYDGRPDRLLQGVASMEREGVVV